MGFLSGIFGSQKQQKEVKELPWHVLQSIGQLNEIDEKSKDKLVVVFKHSTRCATSSMALRAFQQGFNPEQDNVDLYFLDLLSYRDVSDEIAVRYQVLHQSPQIIIIKEGKALGHYAHHRINASVIEQHL